MNAKFENLTDINDIGDIIAKSIVDYFNSDENKKMLNSLKEIGVNTLYLGEKREEKDSFSGKTFVVTGTLIDFTRDEVKEKIEHFGGKTSSSVSKKTDVVVVGDNPGSKYDKAMALGITIWNEEKLKEKFEGK